MANLRARPLAELSAHNGARHRSDQLGTDSQVGQPHNGVPVSTSRLTDQLATDVLLNNLAQQVPLKVAIIVPYFQRDAGILCRCLATIFAQKLNPQIGLHVIVVDDSSPRPADEELRDMKIPERVTVAVVMRSNGGPAAARNSGLDHLSRGIDFVAFIDSDDTWRDDHIQRAVDALGTSNDLYFSDHLQWGGFSYLDSKDFGAFTKTGQSSSLRPLASVQGVVIVSGADLVPWAVTEFIAHTSTIVYRWGQLSVCRFDERLRWGGEDDLFLLDLLSFSPTTCVSVEIEVELGFGQNIFLNSWSWDNENNLRRFICQFLAQKEIRRRYAVSAELYKMVSQRIRGWRPALTFFIMRWLCKGRVLPLRLLLSLLREDPIFLVALPVNILRAAFEWAFAKLQGNEVFNGSDISR
jgi:succinoglycan biosynthesis protein ExoW